MSRIILISLVLAAGPALADQKYNPYTTAWETTTPEAELEFNAYENTFEYVPRPYGNDPLLEYNPYSGSFDYVPDTTPPQNLYGEEWGIDYW